jgi:hypothetical protein
MAVTVLNREYLAILSRLSPIMPKNGGLKIRKMYRLLKDKTDL